MTVCFGTVKMDGTDDGFICFRSPFSETSIATKAREIMAREDIIRCTRTRGSVTGEESRFQRVAPCRCWEGDSSLSSDVEILDSLWRKEADSESGCS